jgi:hypothetical protein
MFRAMFHPWRTLRALSHVTLLWHDGGPAGLTNFCRHTISLRRGLTQVERRCTLAHELHHIARGPFLDVNRAKEELAVDREAARQLIDVRALGEALAWAHNYAEAAEELWVDRGTLEARIHHLHPAERAYLRHRLADKDHAC